jgi:hypothetical protein
MVTRLSIERQNERDQFCHRSLKDIGYVYGCAERIYFNVRPKEGRLCALVIVGALRRTMNLVPISDGIGGGPSPGPTCSEG